MIVNHVMLAGSTCKPQIQYEGKDSMTTQGPNAKDYTMLSEGYTMRFRIFEFSDVRCQHCGLNNDDVEIAEHLHKDAYCTGHMYRITVHSHVKPSNTFMIRPFEVHKLGSDGTSVTGYHKSRTDFFIVNASSSCTRTMLLSKDASFHEVLGRKSRQVRKGHAARIVIAAGSSSGGSVDAMCRDSRRDKESTPAGNASMQQPDKSSVFRDDKLEMQSGSDRSSDVGPLGPTLLITST